MIETGSISGGRSVPCSEVFIDQLKTKVRPGAVAVVFNDNNVGGTRTWSSNRIRKLYARERLVGIGVFRKTKQIRDRDTGHVDVVQNDRSQRMIRECSELRILEDELADAVKARLSLAGMRFGKNAADLRRDGQGLGRRVGVYPTVLVRPVCGGCGKPMALSRSTGTYKGFVCLNSIHGGHGCRNKGNKSARIIDEAVPKAVVSLRAAKPVSLSTVQSAGCAAAE